MFLEQVSEKDVIAEGIMASDLTKVLACHSTCDYRATRHMHVIVHVTIGPQDTCMS